MIIVILKAALKLRLQTPMVMLLIRTAHIHTQKKGRFHEKKGRKEGSCVSLRFLKLDKYDDEHLSENQ